MPIDPRDITAVQEGPQITDDRKCSACDYSLKGLRVGMRCPECGQPIHNVTATGRENLTDAPIGYLKSLRFGFALLFWGFVGTTVGMIMAGTTGQVGFRIGAIACTLIWWLGVFITTEPRRRLHVPSDVANRENRRIRLIVRITQGGWTLAMGLRLLVTKSLIPGGWMTVGAEWTAWGVSIVAMASLVALLILLMDFAYWSSNTELADRLRLAAWGLGSLGMIVMSWRGIEAVGQNTSGIIALPFVFIHLLMPIILGTFFLVEIVFLVCLFQLWNSSRWAVRNWAEARAKEQRQRDKADRHARRAAVAIPAEPVRLARHIAPGPLADPAPIEALPPKGDDADPYDLAP